MTPLVQTSLALAIVAAALLGLTWRALAKHRKPGCGGDCGCAGSEIRAKVRELDV